MGADQRGGRLERVLREGSGLRLPYPAVRMGGGATAQWAAPARGASSCSPRRGSLFPLHAPQGTQAFFGVDEGGRLMAGAGVGECRTESPSGSSLALAGRWAREAPPKKGGVLTSALQMHIAPGAVKRN